MLRQRGLCRPLRPTRPTPRRHRRQAVPPAGFGLLPVRSPLLRESSLFLGVLRCFSSPGALPKVTLQVPGRAPGGLPHSETPGFQAASASPGHFAAWPRPSSAANAKASTMRPSCGDPPPSRHSPRSPSRCRVRAEPARASRDVAALPAPTPGSAPNPAPTRDRGRIRLVASRYSVLPSGPRLLCRQPLPSEQRLVVVWSCVFLLYVQCARATRHEPPAGTDSGAARISSHAMPETDVAISRGRRTRRFRVAHCQSAEGSPPPEVVKPRPKSSPDLGRDLPTAAGTSRIRPLVSPPPWVEPRGFEPRTSAVQGRRSPG
jgi:hypothetical protein